jgi:hypothetical protein
LDVTIASIVLNGLQKKCLKVEIDDISEDHMAITHHDDLQLIKDVVRLSQMRYLYTHTQLVTHLPRRFQLRMKWSSSCVKVICLCSLRMAVRVLYHYMKARKGSVLLSIAIMLQHSVEHEDSDKR